MKYVLVYCASGSLDMIIDENKFILKGSEVVTITSGQIHHIVSSSKAKGFVLEFSFDFFCKNDKDIELIFHNGLFCHFAMNEIVAISNSSIEDQLKHISHELAEQP